MNKQFFIDTFCWGFILWLIGYLLGIALFSLSAPFIGWVIMPFGILITLWVLLKKIKNNSFNYYLIIGIIWSCIAIILDYFFLVKLFNPADGYYKFDVYIYYILTFTLPIIVYKFKTGQSTVKNKYL